VAAFNNTAIAVTAAPLARQIEPLGVATQNRWSPDLHTLLASRSIVKEYAGLTLYWLRDLKNQVF
jgi:hypothetical protein